MQLQLTRKYDANVRNVLQAPTMWARPNRPHATRQTHDANEQKFRPRVLGWGAELEESKSAPRSRRCRRAQRRYDYKGVAQAQNTPRAHPDDSPSSNRLNLGRSRDRARAAHRALRYPLGRSMTEVKGARRAERTTWARPMISGHVARVQGRKDSRSYHAVEVADRTAVCAGPKAAVGTASVTKVFPATIAAHVQCWT